MTGTIEILVPHIKFGTESIGYQFDQPSPEHLPSLLADMGVTDLAEQPVPEQPGHQMIAVWTGTTADGRHARIVAWEDVPFDETAIGKALASGAIPPE